MYICVCKNQLLLFETQKNITHAALTFLASLFSLKFPRVDKLDFPIAHKQYLNTFNRNNINLYCKFLFFYIFLFSVS